MDDLIPVILMLVFFTVSMFNKRFAITKFGVLLAAGLTIYFIGMYFLGDNQKYAFLAFGIVGLGLTVKNGRSLGWFSKSS